MRAWLCLFLLGCAPRYAGLEPITPAALTTPLPMQYVTVDGMQLAYVDSGGEGPVLLLVHGLSSSLSFWELQVQSLATDYRVIALDLPGYGASDRPDAPYTPPWFAEVAVHFLDELGLQQVTWVGHSMGGQIGLHAALMYPERLQRLVLAAPAGIETFSRGEADWMKGWWHESRALEADEPAIRTSFTQLVFNRRSELVERWIEERVRLRDTDAFRGTSVAVSRSIAGMLDHPVRARLSELALPVLIVFGTDDHMIPNPIFHGGRTAHVARQGRDEIPGAELVLVPGAGHGVQHDAPTEFDAAVRAFLDRQ
jgi:pimeloyl-ACP methyl ester carboxylesterase